MTGLVRCFGASPKKFGGWLDWYTKIIPRAFNSGQIDGICLHMNPFIGPPYEDKSLTLAELISLLDETKETNYADYLGV